MCELRVCLEFDCCGCNREVEVTVQCAGKGLATATPGAAKVQVPCPTCGEINQVFFETSGIVRSVRPHAGYRVPVPSAN